MFKERFEGKPLGMSEEVKKKAQEIVVDMIKDGESFKEVEQDDRPGVSGSFFIAENPEMLIGGEGIEVQGKRFYIGLFKSGSDK